MLYAISVVYMYVCYVYIKRSINQSIQITIESLRKYHRKPHKPVGNLSTAFAAAQLTHAALMITNSWQRLYDN